MTVDRAHVLATPGLDAHGSYVALSRHCDGVELHYGRNDFADGRELADRLGRDRSKDMAGDFANGMGESVAPDSVEAFAKRRGITFSQRIGEIVRKLVKPLQLDMFADVNLGQRAPRQRPASPSRTGEPVRLKGRFDGLRLPVPMVGLSRDKLPVVPLPQPMPDPERELQKAKLAAMQRHAQGAIAVFAAQGRGMEPDADVRAELQEARKAFNALRPYAAHDAEAAYIKDRSLPGEVANGQYSRAVQALLLETEIRVEVEPRADIFVQRWNQLAQLQARQRRTYDVEGREVTERTMGKMLDGLHRDPQLESLVAARKSQLGIGAATRRPVHDALAIHQGLEWGRNRGITR